MGWKQLAEAARVNYPGYEARVFVSELGADRPIVMSLTRDRTRSLRLIDPYSGRDMGTVRMTLGWLLLGWSTDFLIRLLAGPAGRELNGLGGVAMAVTAVAGMLLWWPGVELWPSGLRIHWAASWRRLTWNLHGVVGAWTFAFVLMWAMTGIFLSFPDPFVALLEFGDRRLLNAVSYASGSLHGGGFGWWPLELMWALLGLVPAAMFGTGLLMWRNRHVGSGH